MGVFCLPRGLSEGPAVQVANSLTVTAQDDDDNANKGACDGPGLSDAIFQLDTRTTLEVVYG